MMWRFELLVTVTLTLAVAMTKAGRPRCKSNFRFDRDNLNNNEIYSDAWQTPCSKDVEKICNQSVILSWIEMQPFTSAQILNKTIWPTTGLLQQIISVALAECCGSCLNITFKYMENRTQLISFENKEESDIILPTFSQGRQYQVSFISLSDKSKLSSLALGAQNDQLLLIHAFDLVQSHFQIFDLVFTLSIIIIIVHL